MDQLSAAALDGAFVVTANKRLARTCRDQYDSSQRAAGLSAWPSPRILPWSAWIRNLWEQAVLSRRTEPLTLLNTPQAEAVWRSIIEESGEGASLLQLRATAISAMSAWRLLLQYRVFSKTPQNSALEDWMAFTGWARRFESICQERDWIDESQISDAVEAAIRRGLPLPERVLLGGFDEWTPQQSTILAALRNRGVAVDEIAPPRHDAVIERVEAADTLAELRSAARWALAIVEREPGARVGVVIPELRALRNTAQRIFTEVFHPEWITSFFTGGAKFHISAPRRLGEYPLVNAALRMLLLTRGRLSFADASWLIRAPFLAGGLSEAAPRAKMDLRMRGSRQAEISLAGLRYYARECPLLARALSEWPDHLPSTQSASGWAETFDTLLRTLGWPGDQPLDSAEYQTVEAWKETLDLLGSLDAVGADLSCGQAFERLREIAQDSEFQPEDLNAPVQLMGTLEASGSDFDHLWITGLDGDSWPSPARLHPFLPAALQIEYGMPHCSPEREYEHSKRTLDRLLASAQNVIVSHAKRDGERELRPSLFVRDLRLKSELPNADTWSRWLGKRAMLEEIVDGDAPPFTGEIAPRGVRVLQFQAQCPFRAFGEIRLDARGLEQGDLGIAPSTHGTALHKALQLFWAAMSSSRQLAETPDDEVRALAHRVARQATREAIRIRDANSLDIRFQELECERVAQMLLEWIEVEKERSGFTVTATEEQKRVEIGGLQVDARIDRIDRLDDGRLVMIDYKTTAPSLKTWDGDRPSEPQLPLYASAMTDRVAAVAFAQLTPGSPKFVGIGENALPGVKPSPGEALDERVEAWRSTLGQLASDFQAGRAGVDPLKGACQFCPLPAFCRVSEIGMANTEGDVEVHDEG